MNKIFFAVLQAKGNCFIFEVVACRACDAKHAAWFVFFLGRGWIQQKTITKTWNLSFLIWAIHLSSVLKAVEQQVCSQESLHSHEFRMRRKVWALFICAITITSWKTQMWPVLEIIIISGSSRRRRREEIEELLPWQRHRHQGGGSAALMASGL